MSGSYDLSVLLPSLAAGGLSGVVVAVANYVATERSNRRTFRRQRLFDLKLEAFTELLSASDALISALEISTTPAIPNLEEGLKKNLAGTGLDDKTVLVIAGRFGQIIAQSVNRARWAALGVQLPPIELRTPSPPEGSANVPADLASAEAELVAELAPFLEVIVGVDKRVNRAFVQLSMLGVTDDLEEALKRFRRRLEAAGLGGGAALGHASPEAKEAFARDLRADWEKIARACGRELEQAMS